MDAKELAAQLESAMQGDNAKQVLGVLGDFGIELSEDELDKIAGGIRLEDGHLYDLFAKKLQGLDLGNELLSKLETALASFAPNGLMGR